MKACRTAAFLSQSMFCSALSGCKLFHSSFSHVIRHSFPFLHFSHFCVSTLLSCASFHFFFPCRGLSFLSSVILFHTYILSVLFALLSPYSRMKLHVAPFTIPIFCAFIFVNSLEIHLFVILLCSFTFPSHPFIHCSVRFLDICLRLHNTAPLQPPANHAFSSFFHNTAHPFAIHFHLSLRSFSLSFSLIRAFLFHMTISLLSFAC